MSGRQKSAIASMFNSRKGDGHTIQAVLEPSISSGAWLHSYDNQEGGLFSNESELSSPKRVESEREVSEITHDNTMLEQSIWESECVSRHHFSSSRSIQKPMLIKEVTETVEIDEPKELGRLDGLELAAGDREGRRGACSEQQLGDCEHTRVTMIRDVRTNIQGLEDFYLTDEDHLAADESEHKQVPTPRVDLETLYIVEHGRKMPVENGQAGRYRVDYVTSGSTAAPAERLRLDDLLRLNSHLTKDESSKFVRERVDRVTTITEEDVTVRYELHEYHHATCLMMYVAEMDEQVRRGMEEMQRTLKEHEKREACHLDIIVDDDMSTFILPRRRGAEESEAQDNLVSVNYIRSSDQTLIGCERRAFNSLPEPIKAALSEDKAKLGSGRYLSVLVVSKNTGRRSENGVERRPRKTVTSHHILEQHLPLLTKLREQVGGADETDDEGEKQCSRIWAGGKYEQIFTRPHVQRQDEAIQVKPLVCDEATISSVRGSLRQFRVPTVQQRDATTSPIYFAEPADAFANNNNDEDEYAAEVYCTNLDLTTNKRRIPGLTRVPIMVAHSTTTESEESRPGSPVEETLMGMKRCPIPINIERRQLPLEEIKAEQDKAAASPVHPIIIRSQKQTPRPTPSRFPIQITREKSTDSSNKGPAKMENRVSAPPPSGTCRSRPLVVKSKDELVHSTLEQLRRSIRQHSRDTYRVQLDSKKRSNSWTAPVCSRQDGRTRRSFQERHVRAKLIPVWNSADAREYFARVEDYINEHAAKSIKRSYSTGYLVPGLKSRVRWIRIPGETLRIEERKTIEMRDSGKSSQARKQMVTAECRELPYELRYWNILHLLNQERVTGKQLGKVFPCPLEEWVMSENYQSGVKETAQEILSHNRARSSQDSSLLWFLTYDENAEKTTQKYLQALLREGRPAESSAIKVVENGKKEAAGQTYKRVETVVRYEKLPDRVFLVDENGRHVRPVVPLRNGRSASPRAFKSCGTARGQLGTPRPAQSAHKGNSVRMNQMAAGYRRYTRPMVRPVRPPYRMCTPQMYINGQRRFRMPVNVRTTLPVGVRATPRPITNQPSSSTNVTRNNEVNWC